MGNLLDIFADFNVETATPQAALPDNPDRPLIPTYFGKQLVEYLDLDLDKGPWLAGGAVRKFYLNESLENSDWDFWFRNIEQYNIALQRIKDLKATRVYETENAISFKYYVDNDSAQTIQLIRRRFFDKPQQIINGFDFSVCQLVTDGHKVIVGNDTIRDIKSRTLRLAQENVPEYIIPRIIKYMVYGYRPNIELVEKIENNNTIIDWSKEALDYDAV